MEVFLEKDVFSALIHYILYTRAREEGGRGGEPLRKNARHCGKMRMGWDTKGAREILTHV